MWRITFSLWTMRHLLSAISKIKKAASKETAFFIRDDIHKEAKNEKKESDKKYCSLCSDGDSGACCFYYIFYYPINFYSKIQFL